MSLTDRQHAMLDHVAERVRDHFDSIEQDVPDSSFLVGGAVRDAMIGLEANDFDFVVVGETPETMEARGFEPIEASSFPVFHDSEHEEWALARTEQKSGEGYTGFEVFTDDVSLREDLERRDLTMNAMAMLPKPPNVLHEDDVHYSDRLNPSWSVIDPHDGAGDIEDGVLRHVSEAFAEDPLRVLRVARYAGRFAVPTDEEPVEYVEQPDGGMVEHPHRFVSEEPSVMHAGFRVAEETQDMMRRVAPELNRMSRDRIGTEIEKALAQARRPSRIFEVLRDSGALAVLWPELDRAELVPAGPEEHHAEGSTFDHTMMVLDRMHRLCVEHDIDGHDRVRRLLAALAHDIGKVVSGDKQGGLHSDDPPIGFAGHDALGASIMEDTARRLGLSSEFKNVMADACALHMDVHDVPMMAPNELLDFFEDHIPPKEPSSRTLALGAERDSGERKPIGFHTITVWEMIDLAHADHEGRLKITMEDEIRGTDLVRKGMERPEFEREPFVRAAEAVIDAQSIEGYEALETGLCDEHADSDIDRTHGIHEGEDKTVQAVMSECPECRTPDDWVGEMLESMKVERLQAVLEDNC